MIVLRAFWENQRAKFTVWWASLIYKDEEENDEGF